jgi:hypothetical protein
MATDKKSSVEAKKCVTHEFRLSFPALITPKSFEDQAAKYSLTMLFPKSVDLGKPAAGQANSLKKAAFNAATEKWGPREKWPKNLRMPFRDGDVDRSETDGYAGHFFVSASSKNQPGIVGPSLQPILNERDIYAGCYCRAEVIAFAYDTKGNKGVSFSLQNVQKLRDGEPFSGRKDAASVFDSVEDTSEDEGSYSESGEADLGF